MMVLKYRVQNWQKQRYKGKQQLRDDSSALMPELVILCGLQIDVLECTPQDCFQSYKDARGVRMRRERDISGISARWLLNWLLHKLAKKVFCKAERLGDKSNLLVLWFTFSPSKPASSFPINSTYNFTCKCVSVTNIQACLDVASLHCVAS